MIRETAILPDFPDYHGFWGFDPGKSLFFDIETSGLSAASSHVFLIGTICRTEHGWQLTQYLAERTSEEPELLAAFLADAASFSTLIHFNGTTFDLPYINARTRACHLPILYDDTSDLIFSIDLYQRLRRLKKLSGYAHMKQKDLEAFAGWQREDTLTGKHLIAMFHAYEKTSDPELRRLMLLHNHDDLVGMTRLLPLAAYLMLAEGQFASVSSTAASASHGLPRLRIQLELAAPLPRGLSLSVPCPAPSSEETFFELFVNNLTAILEIPGVDTELKYFFQDYKNYYYLPLEDQAIHKSVAAYVEKEYRTPAKAATCYTRKSGRFYMQPSAILTPSFRPSYESRDVYFAWQDDYGTCPELLRPLVTATLQQFLL